MVFPFSFALLQCRDALQNAPVVAAQARIDSLEHAECWPRIVAKARARGDDASKVPEKPGEMDDLSQKTPGNRPVAGADDRAEPCYADARRP